MLETNLNPKAKRETNFLVNVAEALIGKSISRCFSGGNSAKKMVDLKKNKLSNYTEEKIVYEGFQYIYEMF